MPRFKYKAVGANGQIQQGLLDAATHSEVIETLQNAGHMPIGAWEVKSQNLFSLSFAWFKQKKNVASRKELIIFMSELSTLLQAGLPLDNSLKTMENLTFSPMMKNVIRSILEQIQEGVNLSDAMMHNPSVFNQLQISIIRAGEAGGELYRVIGELADYMERSYELRSSVINALIYPFILLVMSVSSLLVLMTFVVPNFVPLFEDMGQALPMLTQITFAFAGFMQGSWWIILCFIALLVWFGDRRLEDPAQRKQVDSWCLRLPILGDLIRNMETARFTRTLGTLINNGVPLLYAVVLSRDVVSNRQLAEVMYDTTAHLEKGQGLSKALRESKLFPALSVQLIEVGEESGNLGEMLMKVANIYDKEVQNSLKRMLTVLEPILILGLGGIIGIIIISILMAMLGLNELVV